MFELACRLPSISGISTDLHAMQNDGLQWIIDEALTKNDPTELNARRIGERLIFLNDVSMHTTSYTMQNFILNLYSSDPKSGYIEVLREECRKVFDEAGNCWSRDAVQNLKLLDAAIRESMRVSPFSVFGLPRRVSLLLAHRFSRLKVSSHRL